MAGVEFDHFGERVNLDEQELDWLLGHARARAGSSSALGELATMLAGIRSGTRPQRGPIVLHRPDGRAIRSLLEAHTPPTRGLQRLRTLLQPR